MPSTRPAGHRFRRFTLLSVLLLLVSALLFFWNAGFTDGLQKHSPSFPAASEKSDTTAVRFAALGDTGSGAPGQMALARRLWAQYQATPFPVVLVLGDVIYPDGDVKALGEARFTRPFLPLLESGVVFRVALGNHDVMNGHRDDAMAFYGLPAAYYTFREGPVAFFVLDTNAFDDAQRAWLEAALAASDAPWKVVYGHHPVYSSGKHGSTEGLLDNLRPVLEKHRVPLYLSGHEHNYERLGPVAGVTYVVSGGGGAYLREFGKVLPQSQVRASKHHFLVLEADRAALTVTAIDADGAVLDRASLKR